MPVIDERVDIAIVTMLVATDLTYISDKAVAYASALARRYKSMVELVNVINVSATVPSAETLVYYPYEEIKRSSQEGLHKLAEQFQAGRATTSILEGFSPGSAILDAALETRAELIVMGTSSKQGLDKFFLGSTAEQVIRKAKCPVLTVGPQAAEPGPGPLPFRTIVYASDFSAEAAKAAAYALAFAEDGGGHLYLCHVLPEGAAASSEKPALIALGELIPPFASDWCTPECVLEHGKAAEGVLALANRVQADLIVLGARKSSLWLSYIETGVSPAILAEAKCPVLTVC